MSVCPHPQPALGRGESGLLKPFPVATGKGQPSAEFGMRLHKLNIGQNIIISIFRFDNNLQQFKTLVVERSTTYYPKTRAFIGILRTSWITTIGRCYISSVMPKSTSTQDLFIQTEGASNSRI